MKNQKELDMDNQKILFFSMPKTSSTSWNKALSEAKLAYSYSHNKRLPNWIDPKDFENIDEYWAFTFMRNPIDRFISAFNYLKKGGLTQADKIESIFLIDKKYENDISGWVIDVLDKNPIVLNQLHFRPQHAWIFNNDNTNFNIFKYEDQRDAIDQVSSIAGINLTIPFLNKTGSKNSELSEEALNILKRIYQKDIDIWQSL